MTDTIHLISAGAAKGLVEALQPAWSRETGVAVQAMFGAVGAMQEKFLEGTPCDVLILTEPLLRSLVTTGHVDGATIVPLGVVRTGIATRGDDAAVAIGDAEELKRALLGAPELYLPDPQRATAGIHCARVLRELGIADALDARLRPFPNGATAMRALADHGQSGALGCTQVTEILYTKGVTLVGPLPAAFELATLYSIAVSKRATDAAAAKRFQGLLADPVYRALRAAGGFEPSR